MQMHTHNLLVRCGAFALRFIVSVSQVDGPRLLPLFRAMPVRKSRRHGGKGAGILITDDLDARTPIQLDSERCLLQGFVPLS